MLTFVGISWTCSRAPDTSCLSDKELMTIPEGFDLALDAVYVINLDRSRDRLIKISSELNDADLEFIRFPAVDGKIFEGKYERFPNRRNWVQDILPEKNYSYMFDPKINPYGLSIGELGNYFSHFEILKKVADAHDTVSLVLEDDAHLEDDFMIKLASLLAHAPPGWDIIYLNCFAKLSIGCRPEKLTITGDRRFTKLNRPCTAGNGAYLINEKGARKLLQDIIPATNRTDERIGHEYFSQIKMNFSAFCAHPELISVGNDGSIIDEMGRHNF